MKVGVEYFVGLSAVLFGIGLYGIFIRRSPMIILLSVELVLNADRTWKPPAEYLEANVANTVVKIVLGFQRPVNAY